MCVCQKNVCLSKKCVCQKNLERACSVRRGVSHAETLVIGKSQLVHLNPQNVHLTCLNNFSVHEFLDYEIVNRVMLFLNLLIVVSYPVNFAIYCSLSRLVLATLQHK